MTLDTPKSSYSSADRFAREQSSGDKYECRDGEALLIAGGTADHSPARKENTP